MKFLADMGISPRSVAFLRGLGYDAIHLYDEGLDRLSDADILSKARTDGRIVLTMIWISVSWLPPARLSFPVSSHFGCAIWQPITSTGFWGSSSPITRNAWRRAR